MPAACASRCAPSARLDAFAAYRGLRLAAAADAFAGTVGRDPTARSGRDAGRQIDLRLRVWIVPGFVRVEAGTPHLIERSFLRLAPNASHRGDLITSLEEAQAAGRVQARLKVLTHPALLVVDEIGYATFARCRRSLSWAQGMLTR
jgi:hypothetical protein